MSVSEKGNNFHFSKWMQAKKRICHNTISTFYPLTPMSHFSLFAYWDNAHKTNILKFVFNCSESYCLPFLCWVWITVELVYISSYKYQTLDGIVQGNLYPISLLGWNPSWPKYILFNQSFYVKVRIYHRASNIIPWHPNCCSHRFKTGVFLCMFERGSIMSYAIYHAVWILQCSLFWPWILVSSTLCC